MNNGGIIMILNSFDIILVVLTIALAVYLLIIFLSIPKAKHYGLVDRTSNILPKINVIGVVVFIVFLYLLLSSMGVTLN